MTRIAIISPLHNEVDNVDALCAMLALQTFQDFDWIVVDDGSDDGTVDRLLSAAGPLSPQVISKENDGGLVGGSAFSSWRRGIDVALGADRDYTHFMKLDADVRLSPGYLSTVLALFEHSAVGLAGGVINSPGQREQAFHVAGPVKMYSRRGLGIVLQLPSAIGFDIMDEMILAKNGLSTEVSKRATFELARETGASEGEIHGRVRHGRGCRWTGYSFPYFVARCLRYFLRRPYIIGPFAMFWGYCAAGQGPYDPELRKMHAQMQRGKLLRMFRNPVRFYRDAYSTKAP
jgi:dolichol-phosphate mannosyltransferase